ncbi:MAG TPA: hypothetical protein VEX60_11575 [Pyrinomonadaceae bacterium]|nr:hypothetical protein [Pyrinomonadaceae bacterium]
MSRNINRAAADKTRKTRRRNSILLSVAVIAVIIVLLALEQVALLYLVATLGVAALLVIVAFADLQGATPEPAAALPGDDSAAIADAVTRTTPATSFGSTRPRAAKRRRR